MRRGPARCGVGVAVTARLFSALERLADEGRVRPSTSIQSRDQMVHAMPASKPTGTTHPVLP